jgi:hypothetical protein
VAVEQVFQEIMVTQATVLLVVAVLVVKVDIPTLQVATQFLPAVAEVALARGMVQYPEVLVAEVMGAVVASRHHHIKPPTAMRPKAEAEAEAVILQNQFQVLAALA